MPKIEYTIDIQAPIEKVFPVLTDPRRVPEWNPSVVDVSDVEYPLHEGSTWHQVTMILNRPAHVTCRITRYDAPREGVLEVTGDYRARLWTRCEPFGEGTRVTEGMDFDPPGGALGKMAVGLMRSTIQRELEATMERQRAAVERERGGVGGSGTSQ